MAMQESQTELELEAISKRVGLFVGLVTLDIEYLADEPPIGNQKQVARDYAIAAGGPATNAAVTFAACGHSSTIAGVLGKHAIAGMIRSDLETYGVRITDLAPNHTEPPPTSSIVITQRTGDRAVISLNAVKHQAQPNTVPATILSAVDIVLIDGHQMAVGEAVARRARDRGISVIVDAGSWKPNFETVLAQADYVIASANFRPPQCQTQAEVIAYLARLGIPHIAVTRGANPICFVSRNARGEIAVPSVPVVDTLGAGDVFHGALCHFILNEPFEAALADAARVAAEFCTSFGTRSWLQTFVRP
ncbi:MAG: PfkB family carbohydrate kinase [Cyanobacteria bacterium P01_F01_bin.33]